jgi:hypothetical protein
VGTSAAIFALLPVLISGYIFNTLFYPSRYFSNQVDGQRLFFMAAGSGVFLACFVFLASAALAGTLESCLPALNRISAWLNQAIPVPHASKILLTLISAVVLPLLFNLLLRIRYGERTAQRVFNRLTDRFGNPLCRLLRSAADRQKLVVLTFSSRKVYCGRVLEVPQDIEREDACVELLPSFSGYRDKDTLRFGKERTDYPVIALWEAKRYLEGRQAVLSEFDKLRAKLVAGGTLFEDHDETRSALVEEIESARAVIEGIGAPPNFDPGDWIKIFPIREIESASFYDTDAYERWFLTAPEANVVESDASG